MRQQRNIWNADQKSRWYHLPLLFSECKARKFMIMLNICIYGWIFTSFEYKTNVRVAIMRHHRSHNSFGTLNYWRLISRFLAILNYSWLFNGLFFRHVPDRRTISEKNPPVFNYCFSENSRAENVPHFSGSPFLFMRFLRLMGPI